MKTLIHINKIFLNSLASLTQHRSNIDFIYDQCYKNTIMNVFRLDVDCCAVVCQFFVFLLKRKQLYSVIVTSSSKS